MTDFIKTKDEIVAELSDSDSRDNYFIMPVDNLHDMDKIEIAHKLYERLSLTQLQEIERLH